MVFLVFSASVERAIDLTNAFAGKTVADQEPYTFAFVSGMSGPTTHAGRITLWGPEELVRRYHHPERQFRALVARDPRRRLAVGLRLRWLGWWSGPAEGACRVTDEVLNEALAEAAQKSEHPG